MIVRECKSIVGDYREISDSKTGWAARVRDGTVTIIPPVGVDDGDGCWWLDLEELSQLKRLLEAVDGPGAGV